MSPCTIPLVLRDEGFMSSNIKTVPTEKQATRFEFPCAAFCKSCREYIRKGTIFHAEKRIRECADKSSAARIVEFLMTCERCGSAEFIVQINRCQGGFDLVKGLKKIAGTSNKTDSTTAHRKFPNGDDDDTDVEEQTALDRFLVTGVYQSRDDASVSELRHLRKAQQFQKKHFQNDADANAALRASFRRGKKEMKRRRWDGTARVSGSTECPLKIAKTGLHRKLKSSSIFSKTNSRKMASVRNGSALSFTSSSTSSATADDKPDHITSSSSSYETMRSEDTVKKKKILLISAGTHSASAAVKSTDNADTFPECRASPSVAHLEKSWSAMEALAGYGSGSDCE